MRYKIQIDFKTDRQMTDEEMANMASYMNGSGALIRHVGERSGLVLPSGSSDVTLKIEPVVDTNVAVDIERSDWTCPAR